MLDADAVRNWAWWSSDSWERYCEAYGSAPGRPIQGPSYVVNLQEDPWQRLSKGRRSTIKAQMAKQHIRTVSDTAPMQRAHLVAAGRQTRSQSTWDLMSEWITEKRGVCATNGEGGWVYVICDPPGAFYASAAGGDSHYLMYKVIEGLKYAGFDWLELGEGHTEGIDAYKRGFSTDVID